ncbi:hypothetical protein Hdeb2414_s0016g00481071 [Helianthus debilis subsp. tardiflorus]
MRSTWTGALHSFIINNLGLTNTTQLQVSTSEPQMSRLSQLSRSHFTWYFM